MVVEEQHASPVETDERPLYEGPVVEDIEVTEGPAIPAAVASE